MPPSAAVPLTRSTAVNAQVGSSKRTESRLSAQAAPGQNASAGSSTFSPPNTQPDTETAICARMRQRPFSSSQVAESSTEEISAAARHAMPAAASSQGISARKGMSRS